MNNVLIGAGGHAAVVYEISQQQKIEFDSFIDPEVQFFNGLNSIKKIENDALYFMGLGGVTIDSLLKRQTIYDNYYKQGFQSFVLKSDYSYVSSISEIGMGTLIAHRAVVQVSAKIGRNVIINTGAIIEHDAVIEDGCHIAPGAIVLGGAKICFCSMIGAGAVVLPNQIVPENTLISSLTRYKNEK
jgi:sugar O-acyltransferase (sialic acid O-acetyltransferase NeuD family)